MGLIPSYEDVKYEEDSWSLADILHLKAHGLNISEIARELNTTPFTIRRYLNNSIERKIPKRLC